MAYRNIIILTIFFSCYIAALWMPQGKAEEVTTTRYPQQIPARSEQEALSFVGAEKFSLWVEEPLQVLKKGYFQRKAEEVTTTRYPQQIPARSEQEVLSFAGAEKFSLWVEEPLQVLKKGYFQKKFLDEKCPLISVEKGISSEIKEKNESLVTSSPLLSVVRMVEPMGSLLLLRQIHSLRPSSSIKVSMEGQTPSGEEKKIQGSSVPFTPEKRSIAGEESAAQTPAVDNKSLQSIPEKEASPLVSTEEGRHFPKESFIDTGDQPIVTDGNTSSDSEEKGSSSVPHTLSDVPVHDGRSLVAEEKGEQILDEDTRLHQAIHEEEISSGVEHKPEKERMIDKDHQSIVIEKEIAQDTEKKSVLTTPSITTRPELTSPSGIEKNSPEGEEKSTQIPATDNKSLTIAPEKDSSSPAPFEESSYRVKEGVSGSFNKEIKEPLTKEKAPAKSSPEITNEETDLKPAWDVWHSDPTHGIILAVAITLIAAKIGGWIARMVKLPEVVGNLIVGMLLGNIYLITGTDFFNFLRVMPFLKMISYFGTLVLLLTAGLNTDLRALLRVGASSLLVCLGGIIAPAGLGLMVGYFLLPDISTGTSFLLAIILCNSSTGLLLAILSELKAINTLEGRVIAGATILTDIVVILTFGIVSGIVAKGGVSLLGISVSFGVACSFLIIALIAILRYGERFGNFLTKRLTEGLNIPIVVILSLLLAFMSGSIGLHTVIGAFVAGLFLRNVRLKDSDDKEHRTVESFIRPFYMILVPILFVRVGAQVDLKSFLNMDAILLGLAITGAAIVGKLFCCVCPIEKGINRLAIGIGMATKLEGTLILAGIGRDMGILSDIVFSSLIMVIMLTSIICPSFLRTFLLKKKGASCKSLHFAAEKQVLEEVTVK